MQRLQSPNSVVLGVRYTGLARAAAGFWHSSFLAVLALVWLQLWLVPPPFPGAHWPAIALLVLAAALSAAALARRAPVQNALLATLAVVLAATLIDRVAGVVGLPIGPGFSWLSREPRLSATRGVVIGACWIMVIFSSRATAQLALRPWRQRPNYGYWLLALATALAVELDFILVPWAVGLAPLWNSAAWAGHLIWPAVATVILALLSPSLMNKTPAPFLPDYWALAIWLAPNALFVTAAIVQQHSLRAAVAGAAGSIVAVFALLSDVRMWRISRTAPFRAPDQA